MSKTRSRSLEPFKKALTPRKDQRCENCAGYFKLDESNGQCRIKSPTPIMVGVGKSAPDDEKTFPVVHGFFAGVHKDIWCYEWAPRPDNW